MHNGKIVSQLHDSSEFDCLPISWDVSRVGSDHYPEKLIS